MSVSRALGISTGGDEGNRRSTGESALDLMKKTLIKLEKQVLESVDKDSLTTSNSEYDPICQKHKHTFEDEAPQCSPSYMEELGRIQSEQTVIPTTENAEIDLQEQEINKEERLKELEDKIRWIYESSDSEDEEPVLTKDDETCSEITEAAAEPNNTLDTGLRDYLIKELLKQGKDWQWYLDGVDQAAKTVERNHLGEDDIGLNTAVQEARRLSHSISENLKSPYRHSKTRPSQLAEQGCARKTKEKLSELRASLFENETTLP